MDRPVHLSNIFDPVSTPAQAILELSWLVLWICAGIFVVVSGVLVYTHIRFRRRRADDDEPPQVYGSNQIELAWTVIPLLTVFVLFLVTTRTITAVQHVVPSAEDLRVTVVGRQWWWEIRYPALGIVTANELYVPVSDQTQRRLTFLNLASVDVVHSFWVPRLAGKMDVIPNRDNQMWIEPREPGLYLGQCAEYCGTPHANMLLRVVVHTREDFARWVAAQPPPPVQFAPGVVPPEHRIAIRSPVRKMPELSGRFRFVTLPTLQSALPEAFAVIVLRTHVLVGAPLCEEFGIGSGGPKRQPAFVHLVWAHFALLQAPPVHVVAPGEQSATVAHTEAQSALVRHCTHSW